jgi:hypothetical protein
MLLERFVEAEDTQMRMTLVNETLVLRENQNIRLQ